MKRAPQLYPDLREAKVFNNFRYYHHASMPQADLKALIAMKENYIRITKGGQNE